MCVFSFKPLGFLQRLPFWGEKRDSNQMKNIIGANEGDDDV